VQGDDPCLDTHNRYERDEKARLNIKNLLKHLFDISEHLGDNSSEYEHCFYELRELLGELKFGINKCSDEADKQYLIHDVIG
jgi:hypothetical protein